MKHQTIQNIRRSVTNSQEVLRDNKDFYVSTTVFGSNAAATDIIRVPARKSA